VPEILPHVKAETSNAGWNRKEGALYGFFPFTGSRVLSFEALVVSNGPSKYLIPRLPLSQMFPLSFSS
jgi:hypothetical protein